MKICNRCGEFKSLFLFAKDSRRPDGKRSHCLLCAAKASREWQKENKEKADARMLAWRDKNRDRLNQTASKRREKNPEHFRVLSSKWKKANPEKVASNAAHRRAAKINATPLWANSFFTNEAYDLAKRRSLTTGIQWHVDHIIPLRSKRVCGLHVETNLRVIPWIENLKKNNKFNPEGLGL